MMRKCDFNDPNVGSANGLQRCGKSFDDTNHNTICPHEDFTAGFTQVTEEFPSGGSITYWKKDAESEN